MARRLVPAALAALLCACGSHAPVEPAAVTEPRDALQLGMQSYADQHYFAARQLFAKAHGLYRSLDDGRGQVVALVNLADCALILGEPDMALEHARQAGRIAARDGVGELAGRAQLLEAQALLESGATADARARLDALLAGGDASLRSAATLERARLAVEQGSDAQHWLEQARAAGGGSPSVLKLEASAAARAGDRATAQAKLDEALQRYRADHYRPGIAAVHEQLGALALKGGDLSAAHDHYERALAIRLWLSDRVHSAAVLRQLATIEETGGSRARAKQLRDLREYLESGAFEWRIVQMKYEDLGVRPPSPSR